MAVNQPRRPAGTPAGGQWAPMAHAEADVDLDTMSAEEHRRLAEEAEQMVEASFQRSDTDGFLTQWAAGLTARQHRLAAKIAEQGGRAEFPALFDLEGNLVPARLVETRYVRAWGILDGDDPTSRIVSWVGRRKATSRERAVRALEKKGFREGRVLAKAKAEIMSTGRGLSGWPWVAAVRTDGGFSRDVEVIDDGTGSADAMPKDAGDEPAPAHQSKAPKGWWPVVTGDDGEKRLTCPRCGAENVTISGSNLGSDVVRGNNYRQLTCQSCGHGQRFDTEPPR